jgi:hypothetical protein
MFLDLQSTNRLLGCPQDFLLYAIVLCDGSQGAADPCAASSLNVIGASAEVAASPSADVSEARPSAADTAATQRVTGGGCQPAVAPKLTAAEAWVALQLYTASTGKYAAGGAAFMAAVYGVGELPQARRLQRAARTRGFIISALSQSAWLTCG